MKCDCARGVKVYLSAALLVSIALLVPSVLRAQEITGVLTGTATEPSGAVVPGAQVTATSVLQAATWPTQPRGRSEKEPQSLKSTNAALPQARYSFIIRI